MSTDILNIIPTDMWFMPEPPAVDQAVAFIKNIMLRRGEITIERVEIPQFVHPVQGYEATYCPMCHAVITEWFWDVLQKVYNYNILDDLYGVVVPCCQTALDLNDLKHKADAGFARFMIRVRDPFIPAKDTYDMPFGIELRWTDIDIEAERLIPNRVTEIQLSPEGLSSVSKILNSQLRQCWQRI